MPTQNLRFFSLAVLFFQILFFACKKENETSSIQKLAVENSEIILRPNAVFSIKIQGGGGGYSAKSSNDTIVSADIKNDSVVLKAAKSMHYGQTFILITDKNGAKLYLNVIVKNEQAFILNKDSVHIDYQQGCDTIQILSGNKPYSLNIVDSSIIKTKWINDSTIIVIAKQNGNSNIELKDGSAQRVSIPIYVNGKDYSFDFASAYFGYANFKDIAVVDPDYTNCKQVTFEITCKLTGYRGLQTIMGLENNLIIRGKYDDYKPTHPLEIAGLNDGIMLETSSSIPLNQWIHLALTVDGNQANVVDKYRFYIDGKEDKLIVNRQDTSHRFVNIASSGDGNRFEIGRAAGQDFRAMQGAVSMARVWKVIRNANQLKEDMCKFQISDNNGLIANWNFSAGISTYYLEDINNSKYSTALHFSKIEGGNYGSVVVPATSFIQKGCPQ
ncbi:LamG-like jellyroll fold domain-containing protein [Rhizosphaericola mali]|uniref:LamG domain-containing protein n=1 Tax=Rhizosphaericola mali TaxID=2545455 RepID=A0A5P2FYK5_9BACT|nr:LamG-like jellyroll fold domain-containing protein [Rhizosphaericola mali]QES88624.1 LamG domain-containing protein [Rhizosphaericola mali]